MLVKNGQASELSPSELLNLFKTGDLLVLNNTKVNKQRVFTDCGLEVLFIKPLSESENLWEVLFPAKKMKNKEVLLPEGICFQLKQKGLPQVIQLNQTIDEAYFQRNGELALPPYIQKVRGQRNNVEEDEAWYQTAWAQKSGSVAAPTASLHFTQQDLIQLKNRGVHIEYLTLHVGLGTFLPIKTQKLSEHIMHKERCEVPGYMKDLIAQTKSNKGRVWALGTTVTRSLESLYTGHLKKEGGYFVGDTDLFITPGFPFQAVDGLMTNFHQPESTLLALVAAFAGLDNTLSSYEWAIQREFRLFSYGDFSIWLN